jgi:hypothetical protein
MGTIIIVIVVAVAILLAILALCPPVKSGIRASLARYFELDELSGAVEKAQPYGGVKNVSLEVIYDEGRFRIEVVDDTRTREVVAQQRGRFEVAVSYIPTADYSPSPTFAVSLERSSITDDPSLNRTEVGKHLEQLIREALLKKGLTETDASDADVHVAYHGVIKGQFGRLGVSRDDDPNAVEVGHDSACILLKPGDQSQPTIEQAIVLEFFDAESGELTWRAAVQANLTTGADYAEEERRTRQALAAMFATYPPPSRVMGGRK